MALTLSVRCTDKCMTASVDAGDLQLVYDASIDSTPISTALDTLFGGKELGQWRELSCSALWSAVRDISKWLSQLPAGRVYQYRAKVQMAPGFPHAIVEMIGGVKIGGEFHQILTGSDFCQLVRLRVHDNGYVSEAEHRDIRDVRSVATDNFGTIRITKSRRPSNFAKLLGRLDNFLETIDADATLQVAFG